MRRLLIALILGAPAVALAAAPQTTVLDVQNMTCSLCSVTVHKALEKVPGVVDAKVDYGHKTVTVTCDGEKTNPAELMKATTSAGFPSTVHPGAQNQ